MAKPKHNPKNQPAASWEPFISEQPGELVMIQHVGYDGCRPGSLFWVPPGASLGGYLKRSKELVTRHAPSFYNQTKEWRAFLKKHQLPFNENGFDEPTEEDLFSALQQESDEFVLQALSEFVNDKDDEGHYVHRLKITEADFFGVEPKDRPAFFAPVLAKKTNLYQCVYSYMYGRSASIFLQAKSHGEALQVIVAQREHTLIQRAFEMLCCVTRTAGNLPDDPAEREALLLKASPKELSSAFDYAYSKNESFHAISVHKAEPPLLVG
jgi:hypothetical protein